MSNKLNQKCMTNFEKVKEFNNALQIHTLDSLTLELFENEKQLISLFISKINKEVQKLEDAIIDKKNDKISNALINIIYETYSMQYRLGIKGDIEFAKHHTSHMTYLVDWFKIKYVLQPNLTNFEKVKEYNNIVNRQDLHSLTTKNKYKNRFRNALEYLSQIKEEVYELEYAIKEKSIDDMCDTLVNIIYIMYGAQYLLGIQGDDDFDIFHKSNMSRLCYSKEEAIKTIECRTKENIVNTQYYAPYYFKVPEQEIWVVKNWYTGKIVNSINYKSAKWLD